MRTLHADRAVPLLACDFRIDGPVSDLAKVATFFEGRDKFKTLYKNHDRVKPVEWDYSDPLYVAAAMKLTVRSSMVDDKPPLWPARKLRLSASNSDDRRPSSSGLRRCRQRWR